MKNSKGLHSTRFLVQLAVLIALELLLEITGLGYIKAGLLEFTIMQVPVIIGAIVLGPVAGGILGTVFGLTSFWECFGKSAFGAALLGISPVATFVVCVIPRLLMGLLCGLLHSLISRRRRSLARCGIAGLCGALLNTILFMGTLMVLFGRSEYIRGLQGTANAFAFVLAMVGVQGILEAIICCILGAAISYGVLRAEKKV